MTVDEIPEPADLTITRPLVLDHKKRRSYPGTGVQGMVVALPIRCAIGDTVFLANSWAVPLADGSCRSITCVDALEYVRDDEAMTAEFGRILQPGGRLSLRVPNTGPFAGFDGFNLYHYLVDMTRRRLGPVETSEVGWRRHYDVAEITGLLGPKFCIGSVTSWRVGVAELLNAVLLVLFRWILGSEAGHRRSTAFVRRVERWEDRISPGRIGAVLTIEAVKRADTP